MDEPTTKELIAYLKKCADSLAKVHKIFNEDMDHEVSVLYKNYLFSAERLETLQKQNKEMLSALEQLLDNSSIVSINKNDDYLVQLEIFKKHYKKGCDVINKIKKCTQKNRLKRKSG